CRLQMGEQAAPPFGGWRLPAGAVRSARWFVRAIRRSAVVKGVVVAVLGALALMTSVVSAAPAASPSVNGMNFGFAEDATKYADDGGDKLFTEMNKISTTTNRVAVFWNADAPTVIQDQSFL